MITARYRQGLRSQMGYTLFEIMLVLAIVAVLVGSAIYMLGRQVDVAKVQRVDSDFKAITVALKSYEMLNFSFPTSEQGLQALVTKPTSEPIPRRWVAGLDQVPADPWGSPYQYKATEGGFLLISLGPDKRESEDDIKSK